MADDPFYLGEEDRPCARVVWESTDAGFDCKDNPERIWLVDNVKAGRFELSANSRHQFFISYDVFEKLCVAALQYTRAKSEQETGALYD